MEGQLIFSFNDGGMWDMKLAQLLVKYISPERHRVIFYIPPVYEGYANYDLIKSLNEMGIEIGSHTITHTLLTRTTIQQIKWELSESKKVLEDIIRKEVKSFSYPGGYYNQVIKRYVKKAGYKEARTTRVFCRKIPRDPYEMHTTLHFYPYRSEYKKDWKTYAKKFIKEFVSGKANYLHFWGHSWEIEKYNLWDDVRDILSEISYYAD